MVFKAIVNKVIISRMIVNIRNKQRLKKEEDAHITAAAVYTYILTTTKT